jgi:hypothetical protein
MNISILYLLFIICFFIINLLFIKLKLYSQEKYKVSISLFVSFNVLLTAYILLKQITNHQEEIYNIISKNYTDYINAIYTDIIKQLSHENASKLSRELLSFNTIEYGIAGNKIYKTLDNPDFDSVSNFDKTICLQINSGISNYALFYYTHLELNEYTILIKRQNFRMLKIINSYLKSPTYNIILNHYLNESCGLYTLKYFKEFFYISQSFSFSDEEKKIANNIIIDGKVNGTEIVVAPTTYTSKIFKEDLKNK